MTTHTDLAAQADYFDNVAKDLERGISCWVSVTAARAAANAARKLAALESQPDAAQGVPDCSGGMPCTTCPDKRKCQRGCIRQGEALESPDRKDLIAECDAVDTLLRGLGLDPERCRTEGGSLNARRALSLLADGARDGWRPMPVTPTSNMLAAISGEWHPSRHAAARKQYAALLAATPKPQEQAAQVVARDGQEAAELLSWFEVADGFNQGTKAPHKWVLRAEQELRRLAASLTQPRPQPAAKPAQAEPLGNLTRENERLGMYDDVQAALKGGA